MAFNMKRTPIKGKLDDFFSSLGKKATSDRQTKQKASNTGEYAGMTNFEKRRAEKKSRKAGESKFQADNRRRGEERRAEKKTKTTISADFKKDVNSPTNTKPGELKVNKKLMATKVDEPNPKKQEKVETKFSGSGTDARKKEYDAKGWKYDDTIKGYNKDGTEKKGNYRVQIMVGKQLLSAGDLRKMGKLDNINKTKKGSDIYEYDAGSYGSQEEADIRLAEAKAAGFENAFIPSPGRKKSPSKKRGYKMKRK